MTGAVPEELTCKEECEGLAPSRSSRLTRIFREAVDDMSERVSKSKHEDSLVQGQGQQAGDERQVANEESQQEDDNQGDDMDLLAGLPAISTEMAPPVFELD
jgi:hypothetical protein